MDFAASDKCISVD